MLKVSGTAEVGVNVEIFANGESKGTTEINPDTKRFSMAISLTADGQYEIMLNITATTSNGKSDTTEIILAPLEAESVTVVASPNAPYFYN